MSWRPLRTVQATGHQRPSLRAAVRARVLGSTPCSSSPSALVLLPRLQPLLPSAGRPVCSGSFLSFLVPQARSWDGSPAQNSALCACVFPNTRIQTLSVGAPSMRSQRDWLHTVSLSGNPGLPQFDARDVWNPGGASLFCWRDECLKEIFSGLWCRENNKASPAGGNTRASPGLTWNKSFARAVVNIQFERGPHSWDTLYFWSGLSSLGDARKLHLMDWRLQYRKWEGIVIKTIEIVPPTHTPVVPVKSVTHHSVRGT